MNRILVPLDLGLRTDQVIERVLELDPRAEVLLLHVIETIRDIDPEELRDFYGPLEERSRVALNGLRTRLEQSDRRADAEIRYGNRVREILACAEERDVDMVVMGSHPVEGESPATSLATISYQVAALVERSILLVK